MKKISSGPLLTLCIAVLIWLICSPVSTGNESPDGPTLLILSLEEPGRKTAEFSGAPIEAIVDLDQDTLFSYLHWHTGQGDPIFSDTLLSTVAGEFSILLTWKKYPLVRDTADGAFYDTVYVSMGGGLKKSNKVVVKVTNLPVVIDSAVFISEHFSGSDTVWEFEFNDSIEAAEQYPLELSAHDLDGKPFSLQVLARTGKVVRSSPAATVMKYEPPEGDFVDTVTFIAYDQQGSQAIRRLVITRTSPNVLPVIDSVLVGSKMFRGSGTYTAGFIAVDTVALRLYAHDTLGKVEEITWEAKHFTIEPDSSTTTRATWVCGSDACTDSTVDTTYTVDTISIRVTDDRGGVARKSVIIAKGKINQPPEVKSMLFGEKTVTFSDTMASVAITGGLEYQVKIDAVDPEKGGISVAWKSTAGSRLAETTDSMALYRSPAVLDTDTLILTVADSLVSIRRYIQIIVEDIGPVVDSIIIKDTMVRNPDNEVNYAVRPNDTLLMIVYCRDRDPGDSLSYIWSAGRNERFTVRFSNRAKYLLPADDLNDTIICTVQDGEVQTVRKIILSPENLEPAIDSIRGDSTALSKLSALEFGDRVQVSDTITYEVFAVDPEGGSLSYLWSVSNSTRLLGTTAKSVRYVCDTMYYKDTIYVKVSDSLSSSVQRRIILQIDTAAVP